jgi:two-component system sensor histidine kinase QseC
MRTWSLRTRLLLLLSAAVGLAWFGSSVWLYRATLKETDRLFDAALVETAHAVLAVVAHETLEDEEVELAAVAPSPHEHGEQLFYQVRDGAGNLIFRSPGSPQAPLAHAQAEGFGTGTADGRGYRVYTLHTAARDASIHVAQPLAARSALARASAARLLAPSLVLFAILGLAIAWVVDRATRPVRAFAQSLDRLQPGEKPPTAPLPREMAPVVAAIDRLQARVEQALLHERTLTADAAHELRTPLAALRAQAQVALRASDADERDAALREMLGGVDRTARLVDAVLSLARLDARRVVRAQLPLVAIDTVFDLVCDDYAAIARQRGLTLERRLSGATLAADADALALALRNLLDNALRFARTRVRVEAVRQADAVLIAVRDDGPGLDPAQAERVFDRFYRNVDVTPETGGREPHIAGAGLGLALVKRVAELHGAIVQIGAGLAGEGCGIELRLPCGTGGSGGANAAQPTARSPAAAA